MQRILVVSNLYPPNAVGGYEIGCSDVVRSLRRRGYRVDVITSRGGHSNPSREVGVFRWLVDELDWPATSWSTRRRQLVRREAVNQIAVRLLLRLRRPEIVYVFNPRGLSPSSILMTPTRRLPVAYYVSDDWFKVWPSCDGWLQWLLGKWKRKGFRASARRWSRAVLAKADLLHENTRLGLQGAHFTSSYLKREAEALGFAVGHCRIIPWGVELERFRYREEVRPPRRLLYAGRVTPEKGVHTAVEALAKLGAGFEDVALTIAGAAQEQTYRERLDRAISEGALHGRVRFVGGIDREALPEVYAQHDILLLPSIGTEGLPIVLLEAMACGLTVVGTTRGGTGEALIPELNGLTFAAGNPDELAARIRAVASRPEWHEELRRNARRTVVDRFSLTRMVDCVEEALRDSFDQRTTA